jgi:23S rRNA-/tRNA-specific pseudouridylate synthase
VLTTLHEDRHLVVYDKPPGIPVVPDRQGGNNLATQTGHLVCHRLDKETSGVLIMAKTAAGHRLVNAFFAERRVRKGYLAVCAPGLRQEGRCQIPLGEWHRGRVAIGKGKAADTHWTILQSQPDRVLVEAFPVTGRTHQVRAHLAASGAAIIGDEAYGGKAAARLYLHAFWVVLPWPGPTDRLAVEAPVPAEFLDGFTPPRPSWA